MEVTLVVYMLSLTERTLDAVRLLDVDVGLDAYHADDTVIEWLDEWHLLAWVGREELLTQLDVKVEGIFIVLAIDSDEVLWSEGRELGEASLNLRWEDIDATDNHHIV